MATIIFISLPLSRLSQITMISFTILLYCILMQYTYKLSGKHENKFSISRLSSWNVRLGQLAAVFCGDLWWLTQSLKWERFDRSASRGSGVWLSIAETNMSEPRFGRCCEPNEILSFSSCELTIHRYIIFKLIPHAVIANIMHSSRKHGQR